MMNRKTSLVIAVSALLSSGFSGASTDTESTKNTQDNKIQMDWFKTPTVKAKGKLTFVGGVSGAKKRGNVNSLYSNRPDQASFITKGDFGFNIFGEGQNGSHYGAVISLDLRREKASSADFIRAAYAYYNDQDYGTFQVGEMEGALDQGLMDGRDILGGTGGFNGSIFTFAAASTGVMSSYKHASYDKYATKFLYKTPVVHGVQFIFSYTPHSQLLGARTRGAGPGSDYYTAMGEQANKSIQVRRNVEGVLSYGFDVSGVDVNLYAGGAVADPSLTDQQLDADPTTVRSAKSWQLGLIVDFGDIQVGAGYLNNGNSLTLKNGAETYGNAYNAAISYTLGRHYIAAGYMGSSRKVLGGKARADISSLTYEYKAAPGLTLFAEANYFDTRNTSQYYNTTVAGEATVNELRTAKRLHVSSALKQNNKGSVLMVGTSIRF